jgi:hypothetical protein
MNESSLFAIKAGERPGRGRNRDRVIADIARHRGKARSISTAERGDAKELTQHRYSMNDRNMFYNLQDAEIE